MAAERQAGHLKALRCSKCVRMNAERTDRDAWRWYGCYFSRGPSPDFYLLNEGRGHLAKKKKAKHTAGSHVL